MVTQETDVRVEQNIKNKVDILFMIDNSPSMIPKQNELKNRFPLLIKKLEDFASKGNPAWYHIGVVTSDLGSGQFTLGSGAQCHPGGDGGQAAPAATTTAPAETPAAPAPAPSLAEAPTEAEVVFAAPPMPEAA